ncbi:MAG: ROK family protein [Ignavibacteria bacterium]|jgi:glucokinase
MDDKNIIAVDLGGTKILTALLGESNSIIETVKKQTSINKGADALVKDIADSINELLKLCRKDEDQIKAICMGVPGTVNPFTGFIGNAPNLKISGYNIKEALQKYFNKPILIENDVNIAALGIKKFEFNNDVKNMLVVFVGTGIGGALIFDGKLYRGSSFYAGEIGHMLVEKKGKFDFDNGATTFESLASRTAVVESIVNDIRGGKDSVLKKIVSSNKKIKSKALATAVKEGDKVAVKHLSRSCKIIGTVLGSITTLLNIDTIVLGGGVIEAMNNWMMPKIKESFYSAVLPEPGEEVKIVETKLGDHAPLYGGYLLAEEFLK